MNRVTIVIREGLGVGQALNVCGHLALGLGATLDGQQTAMRAFAPAGEAGPVSVLSDHPLIILSVASSVDIELLFERARVTEGIVTRLFFDAFFTGSVEAQVAAIDAARLGDLPIAGLAIFGSKPEVIRLTKGLSLYA